MQPADFAIETTDCRKPGLSFTTATRTGFASETPVRVAEIGKRNGHGHGNVEADEFERGLGRCRFPEGHGVGHSIGPKADAEAEVG
jgi:hypothetical protein